MGQDLLVTSTEPDILRIQTPPPCIPRKRRGSPGEALRNRGGVYSVGCRPLRCRQRYFSLCRCPCTISSANERLVSWALSPLYRVSSALQISWVTRASFCIPCSSLSVVLFLLFLLFLCAFPGEEKSSCLHMSCPAWLKPPLVFFSLYLHFLVR